MKRSQQSKGFALVTALILMVVLVGVMNIMFVGTLGELKQTRASIQLSQARAVAEAGEVYGKYVLDGPMTTLLKQEIAGDVSAFIAANKNAAEDNVIAQSRWSAVATRLETRLNAGYSSLSADAVNGLGTATISYHIENFRIDDNAKSLDAQIYLADYRIVSTGVANDGRRRVEDKGVISLPIGKTPLSHYLFLVEDAQGDKGFFPTGSRFNGPVHANHNWGFWGAPEFLGAVSTADDGAWYWDSRFKKRWVQGDSLPPDTVPVFRKQFLRSQEAIALPDSAVSQERAALGLDAKTQTTLTAKERCNALRLGKCNGGNPTTPSDGVYLVNDGSMVTGGFYVRGDLDVLELEATGSGQQKYTFVQDEKAWVVTVDYALNRTTVAKYDDYDKEDKEDGEEGGEEDNAPVSVEVYQGVPSGHAPLGGGASGQVYVDGKIKDLRAPDRKAGMPLEPPDHPPPTAIVPALARETRLNITATKKVEITSDLIYECDPTQLGKSSNPRCQVPKLDTVLGVMSLGDDIEIDKTAPDNLYLWGAYLAGKKDKGLTVEDWDKGSPKGTLRLYGSLAQWSDKLRGKFCGSRHCGGYLETFDYDQRFTNGVLTPPNFATLRVFEPGQISAVPMSFREY